MWEIVITPLTTHALHPPSAHSLDLHFIAAGICVEQEDKMEHERVKLLPANCGPAPLERKHTLARNHFSTRQLNIYEPVLSTRQLYTYEPDLSTRQPNAHIHQVYHAQTQSSYLGRKSQLNTSHTLC